MALLLSHGYAGQWWWWEPSSWPQAGIAVLSVGMGAAWEPIAGVVRRAADRPLALVVSVNILNMVDGLLSDVWLRSGDALEANPFVGVIGLPAKILLVAAASLGLYRLRPRALIWPTLALVGVLGYHLAGWTVRT